jgi:simple sugar transport system permease protein
MTATATASHVVAVPRTRQFVMGGLFAVLGLVLWFGFGAGTETGQTTTFGLTPGGVATTLPDWVLSTRPSLLVLALVCIFFGAVELVRGFGRMTNLALGLVAGLFVFGFLVWAAAGTSTNLGGLLNSSLDKAVPITLAALSGVLCERAGVVNIAIEGMMLMGAMMGSLIGSIAQNSMAGLVGALLAGGALGLFHGWLSIKYKTNQIVSGTVINIFALGMTSYISALFLQRHENNPRSSRLRHRAAVEVPVIRPIAFSTTRSSTPCSSCDRDSHGCSPAGATSPLVGEHPKAADTGINLPRFTPWC